MSSVRSFKAVGKDNKPAKKNGSGKKRGKLTPQGRKTLMIVAGAVLGTVLLFEVVVIPITSNKVRTETIQQVDLTAQPQTQVPVVKPGVKIAKYTQLTQQIVDQNIVMVPVPVSLAVDNASLDASMLVGRVVKGDLVGNTQISEDMLEDSAAWFGEYDRLSDYTVNNTVGGQVKEGNIVDVIVAYGNGDYDVVAAKKKITNIMPTGAVATTSDTDGGVNLSDKNDMVFAVNEQEYANLELAKKVGTLRVRIYMDESQPASKVTFNPANAAKVSAATKEQENSATDGNN